jgi:hypothetical protein
MEPIMSEVEATERAYARASKGSSGIGAAPWNNLTEPSRDGLRFNMILADGRLNSDDSYRTTWIEVQVARLDRIDPDEVERAIERRAGNYPQEHRLQEFSDRFQDEPLVLRVETCTYCAGAGSSDCTECAGRGYFLE